jgi:hypothetical protein
MFTEDESTAVTLTGVQISTEGNMPQIIVTADGPTEDGKPPIMFRERVTVSDFESKHFTAQLAERLGWAVGDADELERRAARTAERRRIRHLAPDAELEADELEAADRELEAADRELEAADRELEAADREVEAAEPEYAGVSAGAARPAS